MTAGSSELNGATGLAMIAFAKSAFAAGEASSAPVVGRVAAQVMHLAPNTVKTCWRSALGKLNARNRAEAITRAHDPGIL